jgi:hypothetical protein
MTRKLMAVFGATKRVYRVMNREIKVRTSDDGSGLVNVDAVPRK